MARGRGRRQGSWGIWLKRNWVLLSFIGLAIAGVVLSVLLFFEPCDKKTETTYETVNRTVNVSMPYNFTTNVTQNVTTIYTSVSTYNETVRYNATVNVTVNVTRDVAHNVTVTRNLTLRQPFQSTFVLDCSLSVSASAWDEQVNAMVTLASTTRASLGNGTAMAVGLVEFGCEGVDVLAMEAWDDAGTLDALGAAEHGSQFATLNVWGRAGKG